MRKISTWKRIGAVLLVLSLMCGMLLTGVALPATAEAETAVKTFDFTVKDIIPFSGGKYVIGGTVKNAWYDFTSTTVTESVTIREALDTNFDLYYNNKDYYAAIPFGSTHTGDPNGSSASFKTVYENNWLQRGGIASAYTPTSDFDVITAVVPKVDGTPLAYKNFETTFYFDHETTASAAIFGFRQQTPGKFVNADGELNKEQGFVLVSKTGITFGAGNGITDDMYTTYTKAFDTATVRQLAINVKVVNNKMAIRVTNASGTTVYYDNSENPVTINYELAGTFAYGVTRAKGDLGAISLTYLDANGEAKDFDTPLNVNKFRADFSDVIAIADGEGKFASVNAFTPAETDTAIQNWFNSKFAPFYNRESAEYCALDFVGQNSNAFQSDTGNPTKMTWDLEKSTASLRFTRISGYAGTVLRKGFTLALKTSDGTLAKMKNFEAEVDFIVPGSCGRGGVFLSFREKDPGRMQASSGGVFNKEYCGDAVIVSDREVNGIVPGNLQDRTNANNAIAFADEKTVVENSPHTLYVKVVGNKLTWKVIKIDTQAVIGEGVETLTRDLPAGYISVGCTSQTRKLLDIRVTALGDSGEPVDFDNCASYEFNAKDTIEYASGKYTATNTAWCDFNNTKDYAVALKNKYQSAFDGYYNNKDHYAETPVGTTYGDDPDENFSAGMKTAIYNLWLQRAWLTDAATESMGLISSLVPIVDGEAVQYKNFETTFYMGNEATNSTFVFGFRQQTPGKFVDAANVVNKEQGVIVITSTGISIGAGNGIDDAMYNADTTATFTTPISTGASTYIGVTVRVVNDKLTVKVFSSNSSTAYGSTVYYDNSANPITIDYDKAGSLAYGVGRNKADLGPVSLVHLDAAGAPVSYKVNDENAVEHVCDFATPNYDENGHWNECECGEKDQVLPHELDYVVDGDKHYEECACGYETTPVDHDFTEGDCACGEQKPNTAKVEDNIITVKADEGYELKAGSLIVKDANGNYFVPTRVGYRDGGDGTQFEIPANAVAPYTVDYEFYQPGEENGLNMGVVGTSTTEHQGGGLRFIHRLNVTKDGDKLYMLKDGVKVEVAEYGLLLAAQAVLQNPEDLDIETANDSKHVQQYAWPEKNVYYDSCSDYVDIAVHITNILNVNGGDVGIITRTYVKLADNSVYYGDVIVSSYNDAK